MHSALLTTQTTPTTLQHRILQICKTFIQTLHQDGDYKQAKTFFVSSANHFIEKLIHLHSKEVNLFIKNNSRKAMRMIQDGRFQQIPISQIFNEFTVYSKQKNLQREAVFDKLEKLFNYFLYQECSHRTKIQIQNVELEIQCALNYTCPICIKQGQCSGSYSLKNIDSQAVSSKNIEVGHAQTMKQINFDEAKENEFAARNASVQKPLLLKLKAAEKITATLRNQWNAFGNLMGLQKFKFLRQNQTESDQSKIQRLYNELALRNIQNQRAIKHFSKQRLNLQKKQLSMSLHAKSSFENKQAENQKVLPINYFSRKKVHSVGQSHLSEHNISHMKYGVSEIKKNVLRPLANLHHTIQFDRSFKIQLVNSKEGHNQPIFSSRRVHFQPSSTSQSSEKIEIPTPQHEPFQKKHTKTDHKPMKKELLPNILWL